MIRCLPLLLTLALLAPAQDKVVAEAQKAAKAGQHEKAVELIEGAWSKLKDDKAALEVITVSTYELQRFSETYDYGVRLYDLDPKNPIGPKYGALGFFWSAEDAKASGTAGSGTINGLYEQSAEMNEKYLAMKSDDLAMTKLLAHSRFWLNEQDKAVAAWQTAAKLAPKDAEIPFFMARSHTAAQQPAEAINALAAAVKLAPKAGYIRMAQADAYGAAGRLDEAARTYAEALTLRDISGDDASRAALSVWQIMGQRSSNYDFCLEAMDGWIKTHPRATFAYWWKGWIHGRKSEHQKSADAYAKSFELSGNRQADAAKGAGDAYTRMATPMGDDGKPQPARMDTKKLDKAIQWYMKAQGVEGWNWGEKAPVMNAVELFIYMAGNGKLREGARMLEKTVLPVAPNNWHVLNNLGLYYRDTGGMSRNKEACDKSRLYYDRAVIAVRTASDASPSQKAGVLNDAGVLYHFPQYQKVDMKKAIAYYKEALEFDPTWVDANENMGLCMLDANDPKSAIPYFEKALEGEPDRRVSRRGLQRAKRLLDN